MAFEHQANVDELIANNKAPPPKPQTSTENPTTHSYVYLRIQPYTTTITLPTASPDPDSPSTITHLQFILKLVDPGHQLTHMTVTQAVPGNWMELWEDYDWVEDLVAEALRVGVEVVGQEYIVARMSWGKKDKEAGTGAEGQAEETAASPAVEA